MEKGLVDPALFRSFIKDVESILCLRETCKLFAFHVFPKEWLYQQKCRMHKRLRHIATRLKQPPDVRHFIRYSFRGLKETDDMTVVYRMLAVNKEIADVIVAPMFGGRYKAEISKGGIGIGRVLYPYLRIYNVMIKPCGRIVYYRQSIADDESLFTIITYWKEKFPIEKATLI